MSVPQWIHDLASWWTVILPVLAGAAAIARLAWRRLLRPRYVQPMKRWFSRATNVMTIVEREFTANGGSSMLDRFGRMSETVVKTEARVSAMSDYMSTPIFEANAAGENTRVNTAFTKLFGYTSEQCYGMGWVQLIYEDDRDRVMRELMYAIKDKRAYRVPARYVTSAGVVIQVRVFAQPQLDGPGGRLIGWFGSVEVMQAPKAVQE